jgi:hypothetical protein
MQYDFNLGPNTSTTMEVAGKFFKYKSGAGVIRVRTSKGGVVDLLPGQGVWNIDYTSLTIADRSGAQNAGVILAGDFDFHDDRITGTVDVVDGGKARTLANMAFMGNMYQPGLASNFSAVELYNPPGSGKNLVIEQIGITSSNGAGGFGISLLSGILPAQTPGPFAKSKLTGGADSVARLYSCVNAAQQGSGLCGVDVAVKNFKFTEPLVVVPGWGVVVTNVTPAGDNSASISATFEFYQDQIA